MLIRSTTAAVLSMNERVNKSLKNAEADVHICVSATLWQALEHMTGECYLRNCPIDILRRVFDVACLAMQTILRIYNKPLLAVGTLNVLVNLRRAVPDQQSNTTSERLMHTHRPSGPS
jgi:hypothetical protein